MDILIRPRASTLAPASAANSMLRQRGRDVGGRLLFAALVAFYLLPGAIGHDPWKQDETYIADIVLHMLDTGDWIVPSMGGTPFMEKPPLFYWVAGACAFLFSPILPLHDAARLATTLFLAGTCRAVVVASRACWSGRYGELSVFVLLSCLGLERHAHLMLTDMAMLFGFSVAICGLLQCCKSSGRGGLTFGTGVGIAFLGKGLYAPGVLTVSAVLLPLLFVQWRRRSYLRGLWIGCVAAVPWLAIWPLLLLGRSAALLREWIWTNNIGRFFGFSVAELGAAHTPWFWVSNLPWIALPALPLAVATLWRRRTGLMAEPPLQLALTLCSVLLFVLACSASARDNYALPLLVPLAVIAAPAAETLPRWVDRWWALGACIFFGAITMAIWSGWVWMLATGSVPQWPITSRYLPSQFQPSFSAWRFAVALVATIGPVWLASTARIFSRYGLRCWFVGLTVAWATIANLWGPWIDAAKSYRSVFESVRRALPSNIICVSQSGLGESERAMMHYFLGQNAQPATFRLGCDARLLQRLAGPAPSAGSDGPWTLVWSGARQGDEDERFWLFVRSSSLNAASTTRR